MYRFSHDGHCDLTIEPYSSRSSTGPQATYENIVFRYSVPFCCKVERTDACCVISDNQSLLFATLQRFSAHPSLIEKCAVQDAIRTIQSQRQSAHLHDGHNCHDGHDSYNGHNGYDDHEGHKGQYGHGGHDGHGRHDGHGVTTAKTATTVTMTTMATTATAASRNCWLHKVSEVGALMSRSLKVTHLRLNVGRLAHLHLKAHRSAHFFRINVPTSQKSAQLEYTLQVGARTSLRLTYLHPQWRTHTSRL